MLLTPDVRIGLRASLATKQVPVPSRISNLGPTPSSIYFQRVASTRRCPQLGPSKYRFAPEMKHPPLGLSAPQLVSAWYRQVRSAGRVVDEGRFSASRPRNGWGAWGRRAGG